MKRAGNLLERVAAPANLRLAFWKAARGKSAARDVVEYRTNLEDNLTQMRHGILDGTVGVGDYHFFTIHDPKEREICAAAFGERVLHHALINLCEPVFEKRLVFDCYACRTGKGRIKALARAQHYARRHPWFLKLDVRRYFDSIDHAAMTSLLERILKDDAVLEIFRRIIDSHCVMPGKGLPIGNLTSQHFANLYLGELDHFAKEQLRVPGYVRYMDDFVLWTDDKNTLRQWHGEVVDFLREKLHLDLKPPQINRSRQGLPFLGCRVHPAYLLLDSRGRNRFARKLHALEAGHAAGEIGARELQTRATAMIAYTATSGGEGFRRALLAKREFGVAAMDGPSGSNRVLRGGNWNNNADNCRVANRNNNSPGNTNNNIGFRTVRSSEDSPQREHHSDPAAIPPAPHRAVWQTKNARPVPVVAADPATNAPGGSRGGALQAPCPCRFFGMADAIRRHGRPPHLPP
ncbi:MAG: RNA-directed DNA polymerase [Verrucomicrobia bacterium]|nr:RNA-directed DNA polymerase [Verrucomicrobiota bacterium]